MSKGKAYAFLFSVNIILFLFFLFSCTRKIGKSYAFLEDEGTSKEFIKQKRKKKRKIEVRMP